MKKEGINFLGFVDDQDYVNYLYSCDAVIVLTTMPMTLNCGSYEAVAASKPQIVASSKEINSYFYKGAVGVSTENFTKKGLAQAFEKMINNYDRLQLEQVELREDIGTSWESKIESLKVALKNGEKQYLGKKV